MPNIPTHIAIIPDGNRRWAKNKGLPSFMGHRAGAKAAEVVFDAAYEAGIKYLTFWMASISNITKRDEKEVAFLFELFEEYFKKLLTAKVIKERDIRIRVLGFWREYVPESLQKIISELEEATKNHSAHHLTFLLAYNGTAEIVQMAQNLINSGITSKVSGGDIKKHLLTHDLPPVDLVIRTGGDPHLSTGFMMWDISEAQLYFTEKMWPEFDKNCLKTAFDVYASAARRQGA